MIFGRTELTGAPSINGLNNMLVARGNGSFVRAHLVAESEAGQQVQEIACSERKEHRLEEVGPTLREAKKLLGAIQQRMVEQQVEEYLETQRVNRTKPRPSVRYLDC